MKRLNPRKLWLARLLGASGVASALIRLQGQVWKRHVRIVNYHDVPASAAAGFEWQLRYLARHYRSVLPADLDDLLAGHWRHDRPGALITFDDGFRSHHDVAAPLLEKHGFSGWFFTPAALPGLPAEEQDAFAAQNRLDAYEPYGDGRVAMTWAELRALAGRHVIGCHTMNHCRLEASLGAAELEEEIPRARRLMEERLDRPVSAFCWVGGEEASYSASGARAVREAGFELGFMTNSAIVRPGTDRFQLQRTNIEPNFPPALTRFQLCGILDLVYAGKRRRVNRLTGDPLENRRTTAAAR